MDIVWFLIVFGLTMPSAFYDPQRHLVGDHLYYSSRNKCLQMADKGVERFNKNAKGEFGIACIPGVVRKLGAQ